MLKLSERLSLFHNLISFSHNIIFTRFRTDYSIAECSYPHSNALSLFFSLDRINHLDEIPALANSYYNSEMNYKAIPTIHTNSLGMAWIVEPIIINTKNHGLISLGPVFSNDYSAQNIRKSLDNLQVSLSMKKEFLNFTKSLPVVSATTMCHYASMLHYCLYEQKIEINDLYYTLSYEKNSEIANEFNFAPEKYRDVTNDLLNAVASGNTKYASLWNEYLTLSESFFVHQTDLLRKNKNLAISLTSQCCTAAMNGGLDSTVAYLLMSRYITQLEEAENIVSVNEISNVMLKDYLMRVHRIKTGSGISPQIRSICDQIDIKPEGNHEIHNLAQSLGYSEYYFSKKFHHETGCTVKDYIMSRKIDRAKQFLKNSNSSILDISEILNFKSQSYFAKCFKKSTGISPTEYREIK